jgi:hypothetical protein
MTGDFVNSEDNNQEQETEAEQPPKRWFIDLDWFPRNNRSFTVVARGCLCPDCRKRLQAETKGIVNSLTAASGNKRDNRR